MEICQQGGVEGVNRNSCRYSLKEVDLFVQDWKINVLKLELGCKEPLTLLSNPEERREMGRPQESTGEGVVRRLLGKGTWLSESLSTARVGAELRTPLSGEGAVPWSK